MSRKLPGGKKAEQLRAARQKQFEKAQGRKKRREERAERMVGLGTASSGAALALKPAPKAPSAHERIADPRPNLSPDKWERLERRIKQVYENAEADAVKFRAGEAARLSPGPVALIALSSTETKVTGPREGLANANTKVNTMAATAMPPRMASKIKSATNEADELKQCPKRVQKEFARLNALVSKLTGSKGNTKPKVLYFDENWLAARWGMSLKHIRNLRSAGVGPKVTYFGRSVRYRLREVVAFEKANAFASSTDRDQPR